jgi:hypothetical protein
MRKFKIYYPVPLIDDFVIDENVDFHIILESGEVFFGFAATPENLRSLLEKKEKTYFWDCDLIILPDLKVETIRRAVGETIQSEQHVRMFTNIGDISTIFDHRKWCFEDIYDPTFTG